MAPLTVESFVESSTRLRNQLRAAELAWQRWLSEDAQQELRQQLRPAPASQPPAGDGCRQLVGQVNRVRQRVIRLRELCQPPLQRSDLPVIERLAESVRQQAVSVSERCAQRRKELDQEQTALEGVLDGLCERMRRWKLESQRRPASAPAVHAPSRPPPALTAQNEAVAAYDAYLAQHGGPTGGWDADDHALFLKLRTRHRSVARQCRAIAHKMTNKCMSEVVQHVQWYERLQELAERRRQAIAEWRASRTAQTAAAVSAGPTDGDGAPGGGSGKRPRRRSRPRSRPARLTRPPAPVAPPPPPPPLVVSQRKERELAAQRAAAAELRRRRVQQQQLHARQQQMEQQRQRQLRAQLAASALPVFRQRDALLTERRSAARQQRSAAAAVARPRSAPATTRPRCPARLLADTSSSLRRRRWQPNGESAAAGPVTVGLAALPRRAVPAWRAGL
ncbi:Coiled-coil domain-containing protein 112 [Amphibalanus amphitrite]|uniref:Coiled-coil domain-containing protein 112 n=1 Tax=Amphibalanus amphitrite TaxID=1232801 RepID=A0A6A4VDY3_AMPAM|nr:Coiled-coil domain-containing protein 112 [Amphibalanus amphitrite]